jgi:SPP1 gp7 family putative phage head morphogenesis protein
VVAALRNGDRADEIADDLVDRYGVSESRAQLIARDQIGKLNGELNQVRQEELGVTDFIWRTERDNRVRPEHAALEGKQYTWAQGHPTEGIPGEPINCRCFPEPVLDEILAEL